MIVWLVLTAFGTYRIARMLVEEDGPFDVFGRFRARYTDDKRWFDRGIHCSLCVGFWVAGTLTFYLAIVDVVSWLLWPVCWFGVAGAAAKIKEFWAR